MNASEAVNLAKKNIKLNKTFKAIMSDIKKNVLDRKIVYTRGNIKSQKKLLFVCENSETFKDLEYDIIETIFVGSHYGDLYPDYIETVTISW